MGQVRVRQDSVGGGDAVGKGGVVGCWISALGFITAVKFGVITAVFNNHRISFILQPGKDFKGLSIVVVDVAVGQVGGWIAGNGGKIGF